ncbi:MAG: succinylglutamate desuccinylase/aspartoacylase family protein [Chloroflexi bacterium]|nr:succinylglutamate desuccinylase/aspartoacylase family protein [Chloroflexota bacterium]
MKISNIECGRGERAFGYMQVDETRGRIPVSIPINIVRGIEDGPTLLVDAALHGEENIGTVAIGQLLRTLEPKDIKGTLIAVPVVNTAGFEFQQREVTWDGKDLNRQGEGDPDGTEAQRLAHAYLNEVVYKADYYIDIHSGGPDAFVWYTIYEDSPDLAPKVVTDSKQMALAYGLIDVFCRTPWHGTLHEVTVRRGIPTISPEMGGGADFMWNGQEMVDIGMQGIVNVMIMLGMLDGTMVLQGPKTKIWDAKHEITSGPHHGIFMRKRQWGERMKKGEVYGTMYHPYTGESLADILAPEDGTILNSGRVWPVVVRNRFATILGDMVEEITLSESELAQFM